jgi:hypothetical protein
MLTDEDKQWITDQLERREHALTERMRDMQTELLKAFLPFREQVSLREQALEARQHTLDARQGVLEHRLGEIEKKLLLP